MGLKKREAGHWDLGKSRAQGDAHDRVYNLTGPGRESMVSERETNRDSKEPEEGDENNQGNVKIPWQKERGLTESRWSRAGVQ